MGPAALWTQHAYQAELQHPGAITQHSLPCGQECCPSLGPVRMGQGCSHTLPTQGGPPHTGAIPWGSSRGSRSRGHQALVWVLLLTLWHWRDGEASVGRRWPKAVPRGWGWDRVNWSWLQSEPGLLEAWPVQGRWEAGGRGMPERSLEGRLLALSMEPCWGPGIQKAGGPPGLQSQACLRAGGCGCELSCWRRRPAGEKPRPPAAARSCPVVQGSAEAGPGLGAVGVACSCS